MPSQEVFLEELKRRGQEFEEISDEEHARRMAELSKCAVDPVYFLKHYAKTYDPRNISNPYVPFDLRSKQEDL